MKLLASYEELAEKPRTFWNKYYKGAGKMEHEDPKENQSQDPWKHRSKGMCCATCMWFVAKAKEPGSAGKPLGRCRRHAPTMNGYPVVFIDDWCGDHKLDENKA